MSTVAFLGLGNMGRPMALNLARAGHEVLGWDVMAPALDDNWVAVFTDPLGLTTPMTRFALEVLALGLEL